MAWILAALAAGLVLVLAACGSDDEEGAGDDSVTVQLSEQSGSGESGTATLTAAGEGKTRVEVQLDGAPSAAQPAHIHDGSCDKLNPQPEYPLEDVKDGSSVTEVDASLDDLQSEPYAINVHKSTTDLKTYVACGNFGSGMAGGGDDDSGY